MRNLGFEEILELGCSCCFAGHLQVLSLECHWSNIIPSPGVTGRHASNSTSNYSYVECESCVLKMFFCVNNLGYGTWNPRCNAVTHKKTSVTPSPWRPVAMVLKRPWYLQVLSLECQVSTSAFWTPDSSDPHGKVKMKAALMESPNDLNWSFMERGVLFFWIESLWTSYVSYGQPSPNLFLFLLIIIIIIIIIITTTIIIILITRSWLMTLSVSKPKGTTFQSLFLWNLHVPLSHRKKNIPRFRLLQHPSSETQRNADADRSNDPNDPSGLDHMADLRGAFIVRNEAEEVGGNGSCPRERMDEALRGSCMFLLNCYM